MTQIASWEKYLSLDSFGNVSNDKTNTILLSLKIKFKKKGKKILLNEEILNNGEMSLENSI